MKTLTYINLIIAAVIGLCCCYQVVFALVRLRGLGRRFEAKSLSRFAVLIAARNESAVIGQLIDSIKAQDYPTELVDIYVVADNCTDNTAVVAASHGATVYKRQNLAQVGKGYALNFLLAKIAQEQSEAQQYDGFFVFDADNLLDPHYISEMNKVFSNGCPAVTGYRNAKNFGDNWISAGYGMYFLRESEYLNRPRDYLGTSCAVSGTGFLFSAALLEKVGGWHYFALTEDLEFSLDLIGRGEKIAYCSTAVLYDEQPTDFKQSVVQRARWMRGLMQILSRNGSSLLRTLGGGCFACYDMLINSMASVLMGLGFILNVVMFGVGLVNPRLETGPVIITALTALAGTYLGLFTTGWMTLLTEWRRIPCRAYRKVLFSFTYPFFMASFMAALVVAMSGGAQWKPIRHTVAVSLGELDGRR